MSRRMKQASLPTRYFLRNSTKLQEALLKRRAHKLQKKFCCGGGEGKIPVARSWLTAAPSSVNFREIARGGIQSDTSLKAAYFRALSSI